MKTTACNFIFKGTNTQGQSKQGKKKKATKSWQLERRRVCSADLAMPKTSLSHDTESKHVLRPTPEKLRGSGTGGGSGLLSKWSARRVCCKSARKAVRPVHLLPTSTRPREHPPHPSRKLEVKSWEGGR